MKLCGMAAIALALTGVTGPARGANPFVVPEAAPTPNTAGTPNTGPAAGPSAGASPMGKRPMRPDASEWPPTPQGGMAATAPPYLGAGGQETILGTQPRASASLDALRISAIIGNRVLLRQQATAAPGAAQGGPGSAQGGQSSTSTGTNASGSPSTSTAQHFTLIRAVDRKPFVFAGELYVPVIDRFTVTLYRASDKELKSPVWVGEPTPPPQMVVAPNLAEFQALPTSTSATPSRSTLPSFTPGSMTTGGYSAPGGTVPAGAPR